MKKSISLPDRMTGSQSNVTMRANQPLGATVEVYVREIARSLPEYDQPIECAAVGIDAEGNEIAVNTLGRWLFGVPGYQGHVRVVADGETVTVHYPSDAQASVEDFMNELKRKVESSK